MRLPQASNLLSLIAAGLLLLSVTMSVLHGEESAPPAAAKVADPAAVVSIAGTVESLDDKVVEIVTTGDFEPKLGDVFEVFVTPPNGERGRVGRGKISFAKKGVVLGRLDEATGEIAAGLEVSIQSSKPQRRAAATVTPAPAEPVAAVPPVPAATVPTDSAPDDAAPADAALAVSVEKQSGLFVGDDPRSPFVLQVTTRGEMTLVRGLGRMPFSADDPTLIMAEFVGVSVEGDQTALRGVLTLHPDGERLTEPNLSPWVGLYDPASDDWQMMLTPKHVVGASRPGVAAKSGNKPAAATNDDKIDVDQAFTNMNNALTVSQLSPGAINLIARAIQTDTAESGEGRQRNLQRLLPHWNQARTTLAGFSNRTSQPAAAGRASSPSNGVPVGSPDRTDYVDAPNLVFGLNQLQLLPRSGGIGFPSQTDIPARTPSAPADVASATTPAPGGSSPSGATTPRRDAKDPLVDKPLDDDDVLLEIWRSPRSDQISYTLVPTPFGARAWQIVEVIRDNNGRIIKIVNYGNAPDGPDVAQGGAGTRPGGAAPAAPPNSPGNPGSTGRTGSGSTGGTGTTPSGSGGTRSPDSTTQVVNADGSNRVPGSPPTKPPVGPGGPKPPQFAPAPPVPTIPPLTPRPRVERTLSTRTRGAPLDPNITILVDEDSTAADAARIDAARAALDRARASGGVPVTGPQATAADRAALDHRRAQFDAPSDAALAARITAARAALNRAGARDPSGVMTQAKGPKTESGDQHHEAPGSKPDDKKMHSLAGTWEIADKFDGLISSQLTITVTGRTVRFQGASKHSGTGGSATCSGEGTIADGDKGTHVANITVTANSVGAPVQTGTFTLSKDNSTMTVTSSQVTTTWRRVK